MLVMFAAHERPGEQWQTLLEAEGYIVSKLYSDLSADEVFNEAVAVP